jgi:Tol biopolymer transport system component
MKVKAPLTRKCLINAIILFVTALLMLPAAAVDLVSVPDTSFSPPASAGGDSYVSLISADGRYVVFTSTANNLARRSNGAPYILTAPLKMNAFLRDRVAGTTTLISADATDTKSGEDDSLPTGISTSGQFVLFETASRLIPARDSSDRLNTTEVYLRDVINKTTTLVSVRMNSQFKSGVRESVMTPDARYVAFESSDPNFVPGDTNNASDVFVQDMVSGTTQMASAGFSNRISSTGPEITPDGKFVVFAGSLISANPTQDVYVCDLANSNTFCVSTNAHQFFSGPPRCYGELISDDGKFVVYQAYLLSGVPTTAFVFRHNNQTGTDNLISSNSVPGSGQTVGMTPDGRFVAFVGKTNSSTGVFLWDGVNGTTTFVSPDTNGLAPANMTCDTPVVDPTGRFVSFLAIGSGGLVTNDVGTFQQHIYRRDLMAGVTELVDSGVDGNATNRTLNSDFAVSSDGRVVAFDSPDADLASEDSNNASDVFVRDLSTEQTELVSVVDASSATETGGRRVKRGRVRVSVDGNYATFVGDGTDLVSNYTNRFPNIFGRDLINHSNFVVSVSTNGLGNADGASTEPALSGDGRYVVFTSLADNLVSNDTNHQSDVFLRDLQTGATVLASTNGAGPGSANAASSSPTISLDGRYVTFFSSAINIVPMPGTPSNPNLFEWDRTLGTEYALTTNGTLSAAVTPDGRYVAFFGYLSSGSSGSLYVWDSQLKQRIFTNTPLSIVTYSSLAISSNGQWIAYVTSPLPPVSLNIMDRLTKGNIVVSVTTLGVRSAPRFSGDGRFLVYATTVSNSPADVNVKLRDIYLFDMQTRSNVLVSRSFATGMSPAGTSDSPDINADGRFITYESDAPDIVPGDANGQKDIFLFDRLSESTTLLSASIYGAGTADYESQSPRFTGDGQTVTFQSWASDLTTNDFNQGSEVFQLRIVNPIGSTNPAPVFTGQLILVSGSGGPGSAPITPQLTWPALTGIGYRVEYKTNLTDDTWLPVNGNVVIENGKGYITDLAPDPDHRFYRIVAQ